MRSPESRHQLGVEGINYIQQDEIHAKSLHGLSSVIQNYLPLVEVPRQVPEDRTILSNTKSTTIPKSEMRALQKTFESSYGRID
jgi:hypothetical protein